jgi:hypothetical protein
MQNVLTTLTDELTPVNVLPQTNGPVGSVTNANVSIVGLSPAPFVIGL